MVALNAFLIGTMPVSKRFSESLKQGSDEQNEVWKQKAPKHRHRSEEQTCHFQFFKTTWNQLYWFLFEKHYQLLGNILTFSPIQLKIYVLDPHKNLFWCEYNISHWQSKHWVTERALYHIFKNKIIHGVGKKKWKYTGLSQNITHAHNSQH